MTEATLNNINKRLELMPEVYANDVLDFLNFIESKNTSDNFELTQQQITLLNNRRNSPKGEFIPAFEFLNSLKKKYGV